LRNRFHKVSLAERRDPSRFFFISSVGVLDDLLLNYTSMGNFYRRPAYLPDFPPPVPFVGSWLEQIVSPDAIASDPIEGVSPGILLELHARHGKTVVFSKQSSLHYSFSSPRAVVQVLVDKADHFCKGDEEVALSSAIGWGLLSDEGDSHRLQQRSLSPALRGETLDHYMGVIEDTAESFIDCLANQEPSALLEWSRQFSQASAEKALFPSGVREPDFRYEKAVWAINNQVMMGNSLHLKGPESMRGVRDLLKNRDFVSGYVNTIVGSWLARDDDEVSLMDFMVESAPGQPEHTSSVHSQVAVFLQAAMETSASLIAWSLVALGQNPECWDELRKHSNFDKSLSARDLVQLPAYKSFLDEVLRLYPPGWLLPRVALREVEIDGVLVPEGARVVVSPWVSHRSSDSFEEAERFRPERWDGLETRRLARGSYFPFGLGGRICIGERYGRLTATIMLRELARRSLVPQVDFGDAEVGSWALVAFPKQSVTIALG
jgi:cytochrome P450